MRHFKIAFLVLVLTAFSSMIYAQKLAVGFRSGINISDIHDYSYRSYYAGKWKYKPGPSQGVFLDYSISRVLGISTGADFSTVYYENHTYLHDWYPWPPYPMPLWNLSSSSLLPDYPSMIAYTEPRIMNFSFLSIPVQLRLTVPSRPRLDLSAGVYYAFLLDRNHLNSYYDEDSESAKNDFGLIYTAGLSYPVSERLNAMFNVRYIRGGRPIPRYEEYRHGSADFTLGLSYGLFSEAANKDVMHDSINNKIYLAYRGGLNMSWNSGKPLGNKYSLYAGPSLGFNIGFRMSPGTYFRSGISFERQGYALEDSSDYYHRYFIEGDANYYVDTRISADYLVIPALFEFYTGKNRLFYFNTGPYLGFKLNARCTGTAIEEDASQGDYELKLITVYDNLEGIIQSTDIGWIAGMGMVVPLPGTNSLDIGLQFRQGFYEVYDTNDVPEYLKPGRGETLIRNSSLALHVGLRLPVYK
ncbi:MAG: outer membrane beta-barrel protein [Bacteroidales bacterium]|nr:outer membrane beta-barrel protein [Bacteroidales bacterium]